MNLKGKTALVTGASSGMGVEFAKQLAAMGADLVITARRADRLEKVAAGIAAAHGVKVTVVALDLAREGAARELFAKTEGAGIRIDVFINNAGVGLYGDFAGTPWEKIASLLQLDVVTCTELMYLFAGAMKGRGGGHILNIASYVGYMPVPTYAVYAAAKAYVRNLSEAAGYELRESGVTVLAVCPGAVATEFFATAGQDEVPWLVRSTISTPDAVARTGLAALFRGRRVIVPGFLNALSVWMTRFGSRRFVLQIVGAVVRGRKALPKP